MRHQGHIASCETHWRAVLRTHLLLHEQRIIVLQIALATEVELDHIGAEEHLETDHPTPTMRRRSLLVAAMTRTATFIVFESPMRSNSRSAAHAAAVCSATLIVPTSSRNSVRLVRLLEASGAIADGARERTAHVPEEFGFEQVLRNRAAVQTRRSAGRVADC